MILTEEQLDLLVFEAVLDEYWETDRVLLQEKGWMSAIGGAFDLAKKFGLGDKAAEMALSKVIGIGDGEGIESAISMLSMIPDGGEDAGDTGSEITGLMSDIMPAFRDLTSGNEKMAGIFEKYDDAKEKFEEIYEKIEPIKQWLVDNIDNIREVVSLVKAEDAAGLDEFMGGYIPDVAHKKLKKVLGKISGVVGKVGAMLINFIEFVVKLDGQFGDGELEVPEEGDPSIATPSGKPAATGKTAENYKERAADDLEHLNFDDIKSVAVRAVSDLRKNEYHEPRYDILEERVSYSMKYYLTPKKEINAQLLNLAADIKKICGDS